MTRAYRPLMRSEVNAMRDMRQLGLSANAIAQTLRRSASQVLTHTRDIAPPKAPVARGGHRERVMPSVETIKAHREAGVTWRAMAERYGVSHVALYLEVHPEKRCRPGNSKGKGRNVR